MMAITNLLLQTGTFENTQSGEKLERLMAMNPPLSQTGSHHPARVNTNTNTNTNANTNTNENSNANTNRNINTNTQDRAVLGRWRQ